MPLSLHPVISDSEFDKLIDCEWASYETPHNPAWKFFYPIWGPTPEDRLAAIEESKRRQLQLHHTRPSSHWVKVINDDTGAVVGAALWLVFETNPYEHPPEEKATCFWWPEGPKRQMADEIMRQVMGPRVERMSKPHLFPNAKLIDLCFVHPSHPRRGAGRLLVEWGVKKADEMGLEAFVESTLAGKPLYESCGFLTMNGFELKPSLPEETEELEKLQQDLWFNGYFMWRPRGAFLRRGRRLCHGRRILRWNPSMLLDMDMSDSLFVFRVAINLDISLFKADTHLYICAGENVCFERGIRRYTWGL
ncbi:MAG: hypothetical protein Q9181_007923 [Wetmoreana brouardii]